MHFATQVIPHAVNAVVQPLETGAHFAGQIINALALLFHQDGQGEEILGEQGSQQGLPDFGMGGNFVHNAANYRIGRQGQFRGRDDDINHLVRSKL